MDFTKSHDVDDDLFVYRLNYDIKNIINEKIKSVRQDILLGEIEFEKPLSNEKNYIKDMPGEFSPEKFSNFNNIIVQNMIKHNNIKLSYEKRKLLEKKILLIDKKVIKITKLFENKNLQDYSPKLFSSKLIINPLKNKVPKTLKLSDDFERLQKENQAKIFVKKLSNDKLIRLQKEDLKRKLLEKNLIKISDNPYTYARIHNANPMIISNKQGVNIKINISKEDNTSRYRINYPKPKQMLMPIHKPTPIKKLPKILQEFKLIDETSNTINTQDQSLSVVIQSNKKSPYYFNDPKFSKFLDSKHKYLHSKDFNSFNVNVKHSSDSASIYE